MFFKIMFFNLLLSALILHRICKLKILDGIHTTLLLFSVQSYLILFGVESSFELSFSDEIRTLICNELIKWIIVLFSTWTFLLLDIAHLLLFLMHPCISTVIRS